MCSSDNKKCKLDDEYYSVHGEDNYEHESSGLIYISSSCAGPGVSLDSTIEGCKCVDECRWDTCSCLNLGQKFPFEGKRFDDPNPIVECNRDCRCGDDCANKIVQKGPLKELRIRDACEKGLGVFTSKAIARDTFVCEYAGEIISVDEAKKRFGAQEPGACNYILVLREHFANGPSQITVIDPTILGNVGRYMNHSCDPNLRVVPVRLNSWTPVAAMVACKDIPQGQELCYDYESVTYTRNVPHFQDLCDKVNETDSDNIDSPKICLCKSKNCRKVLPTSKNLFT